MAKGMTLEEAVKYGKEHIEDVDIMRDPKTGEYHCIRLYASEHWQQHYIKIAELRVRVDLTMV